MNVSPRFYDVAVLNQTWGVWYYLFDTQSEALSFCEKHRFTTVPDGNAEDLINYRYWDALVLEGTLNKTDYRKYK